SRKVEMQSSSKHLYNSVLVLLVGQGSRLVLQTGYFVVLARMLGVSSYGAFAATLALTALLNPFSNLGTSTLMVKGISRDHSSAPREWQRAVVFTVLGGTLLAVLLGLFGHYVAPNSVSKITIFEIALADLFGLKLIELCGGVWQALGRSLPLAVLPSLVNLLRLLAAASMWALFGEAALSAWGHFYALASLPLAVVVTIITSKKIGVARNMGGFSWKETREGLLYSVALASQNIYNDIDKIMLAGIGTLTGAGLYSAAFRLVDVLYVPVRAVASAAFPHFFKAGQNGLVGTVALSRRLAPAVVGYGVLGGLGALVAAPLAPLLLGTEYSDAVVIVRALAPLVLLRSMSFLAADALTGCGRQLFRTGVQIGVAVVNVGLNMILIPATGIWGAVASTLACETLLAATLWVYIAFIRQHERRHLRTNPTPETPLETSRATS
ncbi:MAG: hypothetical protein JWP57_3998, partial [Spirosoma sp.]|nr:hypothetical protein [Spirosoma sp.]